MDELVLGCDEDAGDLLGQVLLKEEGLPDGRFVLDDEIGRIAGATDGAGPNACYPPQWGAVWRAALAVHTGFALPLGPYSVATETNKGANHQIN